MSNLGPFIAGQSLAGRPTPVVNPFTNEPFATVGFATEDDLEAAVAAAATAFERTRGTTRAFRRRLLREVGRRLAGEAEEAAAQLAREAGKPIRAARLEVDRAVATFDLAADEVGRGAGELLPVDLEDRGAGMTAFVMRVPVGPVLGIVPFNFPINLAAHKIAPALAAGCSIVIKPAARTPLSALLLARLVHESGAVPGSLNVVPCDRRAGDRLVEDERFRLLSFTGSPAAGWALRARAGKRRVTLELGGNAALMVEPDADLDRAAEKAVIGGFAYAGQSCISVQRILIHRDVLAPFRARLLTRVGALVVGDPLDPATDVGPLIDEAAAKRVEEWIGEARNGGARVLAGGTRRGAMLQPAVVEGVPPAARLCREEVFGPVVILDSYFAFDEGLDRINDSRFGLQAGLFTRDYGRILRAAMRLEVGALMVNEAPTFRLDAAPYGGVKDSGLGREGPRWAIEEMTEPRVVMLGALDAPR